MKKKKDQGIGSEVTKEFIKFAKLILTKICDGDGNTKSEHGRMYRLRNLPGCLHIRCDHYGK